MVLVQGMNLFPLLCSSPQSHLIMIWFLCSIVMSYVTSLWCLGKQIPPLHLLANIILPRNVTSTQKDAASIKQAHALHLKPDTSSHPCPLNLLLQQVTHNLFSVRFVRRKDIMHWNVGIGLTIAIKMIRFLKHLLHFISISPVTVIGSLIQVLRLI